MRHQPTSTKTTSPFMSDLAETTRTDGPPLGLPFMLEQGNRGINEVGHYLLELQTFSRLI